MVKILFFAVLTKFLILCLNDLLGRRTGQKKRSSDPFAASAKTRKKEIFEESPYLDLEVLTRKKDHPLAERFALIRRHYSSFHLEKLLKGAKDAFTMILEIYVKDDREVFWHLLYLDLYQVFDRSLDACKAN